jgi:hypothetical protein
MNNASEIIKPKDGQGKYTYKNGDIYFGEWKDYKRHGYGFFTYTNGDKYDGQWKDNNKDGHGIFFYKYGDKYDGQWKDGKKNGKGHFYYRDGDKYDGQWKDNKKDGLGVFTWANGDKYEGQWKYDNKDGLGVFTWANGDKYDGQWKDGEKDGQGIFIWTNGDKYDGQWKDDKKNGQGIFTLANGDKYDGQWKYDKKNGQGIFTLANGESYEQAWVNGKPKELISATIKDQKYGDCWAHSCARNFLRTLQILDVIKSDYVEQFYNLFFTILTTNKDCDTGSTSLELITLFDYLKKNYKDNIFSIKLNQSNCVEKYCFVETQENILNMKLVDKKTFITDLDYLFNNNLLFIGRYNYDVNPKGNNKPSLAIKIMLNFRLQPFVSMNFNEYVYSIINSTINSYTINFPSIPDLMEYNTKCEDASHAINLRKWSVNGIEFKNSLGTRQSNEGNFSVKDLKYLICEDNINNKINTNIEFVSLMFDYEKLSGNYKDRVDYKLSNYWKTFNNALEIKKENYEGSYNNYGLFHGNGKITTSEGTYDGEWKNGFYDGHGIFTWTNGNKYEGQWKDNILNGCGVFTWKNGDKYDGQWKDNKKDGQGVSTLANGDKYEGQWKDNKYDGCGVFTWTNGYKYDGQFKNGFYNGHGIFTWTNGDKYDGQFKNGFYNGHGIFTWTNGDKYEGQWKDNKKDGQGVLTLANGDKYEGQWKDNIQQTYNLNNEIKKKYIKYKLKYLNLKNNKKFI